MTLPFSDVLAHIEYDVTTVDIIAERVDQSLSELVIKLLEPRTSRMDYCGSWRLCAHHRSVIEHSQPTNTAASKAKALTLNYLSMSNQFGISLSPIA